VRATRISWRATSRMRSPPGRRRRAAPGDSRRSVAPRPASPGARRVGLALPAAPFPAGTLRLDHQQPGGGQCPRQPDPVAAAAPTQTATRGPGTVFAIAASGRANPARSLPIRTLLGSGENRRTLTQAEMTLLTRRGARSGRRWAQIATCSARLDWLSPIGGLPRRALRRVGACAGVRGDDHT
jgi:hypothetical protein